MNFYKKDQRVKVAPGWDRAGREGVVLAPSVWLQQEWVPVLWDDEEDPYWIKAAAILVIQGAV